jgi:hypothetical protein
LTKNFRALKMMQSVCSALDTLSLPYIIDKNALSIYQARDEKGKVTIVRSSIAFAEYDDKHPERIFCILVKRESNLFSYNAIVKNREYDLVKSIQVWLRRESMDMRNAECCICFKRPKPKALPCQVCTALLCIPCWRKLVNDDDESHCCPQCRTWHMPGERFGGAENVDVAKVKTQGCDWIDQLLQVVTQLDGEVHIIPIVDSKITPKDVMMYNRLAFTTRYADESMRLQQIRKKLRTLSKVYKNDFNQVYLSRKTFHVDKDYNKPITEMSLFGMSENGRALQQVRSGEWLDIFEDSKFTVYQPTIYLPQQ